MGFAPTWLRQVSPPPASQNHFNHWVWLGFLRTFYIRVRIGFRTVFGKTWVYMFGSFLLGSVFPISTNFVIDAATFKVKVIDQNDVNTVACIFHPPHKWAARSRDVWGTMPPPTIGTSGVQGVQGSV